MHYFNFFMLPKLIQHFWNLALNLCGGCFSISLRVYMMCVWERLILEWEMQNKDSQVAFRFVQHLQKACGLAEVFKCLQAVLESKLISNYNHAFSLGLIFTLCSIFLSHISSHRSDYNFIVKSQLLYCQIKIVLVISGWGLAFVSEERRSLEKVCCALIPST